MLFICYKLCSTCKRAEAYLNDLGIDFTYRPIKEENPTASEIDGFVKKSGLPIKRFFNTSGTIYKSLGLKDKLEDMTYEEKCDLLATNGMLCKRPILVTENDVLVGFKLKEWDKLFKE